MARGVAQAQHPTLTYAEKIQRRAARLAANVLDAAAQVLLDVLLEIGMPVGIVRITPVDEVDVEARLEQPPQERALRLQVEHVRPVDERKAHEQRCRSSARRERHVAVERG